MHFLRHPSLAFVSSFVNPPLTNGVNSQNIPLNEIYALYFIDVEF